MTLKAPTAFAEKWLELGVLLREELYMGFWGQFIRCYEQFLQQYSLLEYCVKSFLLNLHSLCFFEVTNLTILVLFRFFSFVLNYSIKSSIDLIVALVRFSLQFFQQIPLPLHFFIFAIFVQLDSGLQHLVKSHWLWTLAELAFTSFQLVFSIFFHLAFTIFPFKFFFHGF